MHPRPAPSSACSVLVNAADMEINWMLTLISLTRRTLPFRFDIVKKLGQGTYGKVQLAINKETGQEVSAVTIDTLFATVPPLFRKWQWHNVSFTIHAVRLDIPPFDLLY